MTSPRDTNSCNQITITAADYQKWQDRRTEITHQITILKNEQRYIDAKIQGYIALRDNP